MTHEHLKDSYQEQLRNLPELESKLGEDHPRLSWSRAVAEETIASFYMANDDESYRDHLAAGLEYRVDWWERGDGIGAWDFILYTCVALALGDEKSVQRMLQMEVKEEGYVRLTVEWFRLQKALLTEASYSPRPVKKTKGEEGVFEALIQMSQRTEPNWEAFDAYWKSTRNRTHTLTILQHQNFLRDGMVNLWRNWNDTEQAGGANALPRAAHP